MLGRCVIYYVLRGNEVGSSECWTAVGAELHSFRSPKLRLLFHNNNNGDLFSMLLRCLNESMQIFGPIFYFSYLTWSVVAKVDIFFLCIYICFSISLFLLLLLFLFFFSFIFVLLSYISFLFFLSLSLSLLTHFSHFPHVYYDKLSYCLCCHSYNHAPFKVINMLCDS